MAIVTLSRPLQAAISKLIGSSLQGNQSIQVPVMLATWKGPLPSRAVHLAHAASALEEVLDFADHGRVRVQCSALRESGNCSHSRRYYLEAIEEVVVHGLRAELRDPKLIAEYVKTYHEEKRRLAAATAADRSSLVQRLGENKR
jgi:hypothetical protein